jgi:hypothetical protein
MWNTPSVTNSSRNLGEEGEVFLKVFLVQQVHFGQKVGIFGKITSLDFGPSTRVPKWKQKYAKMLASGDYQGLRSVFQKAPGRYKADVGINGKNYSVKYVGGARSAIVNHTSRKGFLRVCVHIGVDIKPLDVMVSEYWKKREEGIITEDILNSNPESPFASHKKYLKNILKYFLFDGTGEKDSEFRADGIIEFSDPLDPSTYKILSKDDVIDHMWSSLVFSLRSKKGMPKTYDPKKHANLLPWVRFRPGDAYPKGALHIRS